MSKILRYQLGMKGYEIRQLMKDANVQPWQIADEMGVKRPTVSQVIHGVRSNPRIRLAIARSVDKQVSDLWPDQEQA